MYSEIPSNALPICTIGPSGTFLAKTRAQLGSSKIALPIGKPTFLLSMSNAATTSISWMVYPPIFANITPGMLSW